MILSLFRSRTAPPTISELRGEDAPALAALHASGFERGWDEEEFRRLLSEGGVVGQAARLSGRRAPAGFILSRLVLDEAEVLSVVVAPAARRGGLGRALLRHHLGRLAGLGARTVYLEVAEDNAAALKLYRSSGFVEVGRRKGYYARAGGAPATAIVMRRDI